MYFSAHNIIVDLISHLSSDKTNNFINEDVEQ